MDIDEEAFRQGRVSAELFGYLKIPYEKNLVQSMKAGRAGSEESDLEMISYYISDEMQPGVLYILGPGTTMRGIKNRLHPDNTLLGVDVALDKNIIARDVSEQTLLELIDGKPTKIVVTVIGGQGLYFWPRQPTDQPPSDPPGRPGEHPGGRHQGQDHGPCRQAVVGRHR